MTVEHFFTIYNMPIKKIYIQKNQYDTILFYFLNRHNESKEVVLNRIYEGKYSNEYCEAKIKFNMLLNPSVDENSDIPLDLDFYTKYIRPRWKKPEWGFPKGRRDKRAEENLTCACREFEEETVYNRCKEGLTKVLFVSPERLQNQLFLRNIQEIHI